MITKTEAMTKATAIEESEFSLWEAKIDAALQTHSGRTSVPYDGSTRVRERLANAYRAAGWTVEHGDDQRDGAWLTFT